jgi:spoIIIJ-associated protein
VAEERQVGEERDEVDALFELLEAVADALGLDAEVEVEERDGELHGSLAGDDLGLFIGRHGQTIDAVQHLAQRTVANLVGEQRRVTVDAAGYRERRQETLEGQADEAADRAVDTGSPVRLEAMTPSERRLVHEHLRERGDVETHSEGEGTARRLVVSPRSGG